MLVIIFQISYSSYLNYEQYVNNKFIIKTLDIKSNLIVLVVQQLYSMFSWKKKIKLIISNKMIV